MEAEHSKVTDDDLLQNELAEGSKLFEDGKYIEAIEIFSHLLGVKDNEYVRIFLARCFFRLEKYELASKHFTILLSSAKYHDYATSMLATINIIWGNYHEALRQIRQLPPTPSNQITQIYILYYIFKHTKQDWALYDAEKLMPKISLSHLDNEEKGIYYLACGMVRQALGEYALAMSHFNTALSITEVESNRVKILDEIAALYLETDELEKAEQTLIQVKEYLADKHEVEKGINFKLLGLLERKKRDFAQARIYFQEALQILNEKETYLEAAEVNCLLMELNKSDFYMSAECYSTVLQCERGIKEVKKESEKVIHILDNTITSTSGLPPDLPQKQSHMPKNESRR